MKQTLQLLINRIVNNSYSISDLKSFIHICSSIATAYLKTEIYYKRLFFPIVHKEDSDLQDYAIDLLADLFATDEKGTLIKIKKYFDPIDLRNNEVLFDELKKLILKVTKQELINKFKENDPAGYRLLRNIKLASKRNNKINTFSSIQRIYYYFDQNQIEIPEDLNPELPVIHKDKLIEIAFDAIKQFKTTPQIVEYLLLSIYQDKSVCGFVEQSTLYKCLREVKIGKTVTIQDSVSHINLSQFESSIHNLELSFNNLKIFLANQINSKYLKKDKITVARQQYYLSVLNEYFYDLITINKVNSLKHYLDTDFIISKSDIHRIEYLIKLGKEHLKQELFPNLKKMKV